MEERYLLNQQKGGVKRSVCEGGGVGGLRGVEGGGGLVTGGRYSLTLIGLRKSRLDRKWLCAWSSQSAEDLQMISCVSRDTLPSAMWTNSSSGVVLHRSRRWKPKPLVRTWTGVAVEGPRV